MTDLDLSGLDLPAFDPKSLRRAVRRGVIRTAANAVALFVVVAVVAQIVGFYYQRSVVNGPAVARRSTGAIIAAHPGYQINATGWGGVRGLLGSRFLIGAQSVSHDGANLQVQGNVDFRGAVGGLEAAIAPTAIDQAAAALDHTTAPEVATRSLDRLPPIRVAVVVAFKRPIPVNTLRAVADNLWAGGGMKSIIYSRPATDVFAAPVSWPPTGTLLPGGGHSTLASWASSLRGSDAPLLRALGLPNPAELRRVARADLAAGVVLVGVTSEQLRLLLTNPAIRGVSLFDAQLDLAVG